MTNPVFWLRWLAVLPAGIFAAAVILFPVHWMVLLVTSGEEEFGLSSLPPETLERYVTAFATPASLIYFGSWVAPSYRLQTSVFLAILLAAGLGGIYVFSATTGGSYFSGWDWINFVIAIVLNFAGIVTGILGTKIGRAMNSKKSNRWRTMRRSLLTRGSGAHTRKSTTSGMLLMKIGILASRRLRQTTLVG